MVTDGGFLKLPLVATEGFFSLKFTIVITDGFFLKFILVITGGIFFLLRFTLVIDIGLCIYVKKIKLKFFVDVIKNTVPLEKYSAVNKIIL